MKKKINYRLWSIFSLIVLLFPLLASLGQGSAAVAEAATTTASVPLHKRVGVPKSEQQNTGTEMPNFGGEALRGVTFQAFDVTNEFYRLRSKNADATFESIYNSLKDNATVTQNGTPTISFGTGSLSGAFVETQTTTGDGTAVFSALNKKNNGRDAVYYFHESARPETVTGRGDIVLGFPVYEYQDGKYTENELDEIHLYPKNDQASGGMKLIKTTDTLDENNKLVADAEFVIHRGIGASEEWVTGRDADGNITWGSEANAFKFVTDANGEFVTSAYEIDGTPVNFKFAAGVYKVTEVGAPEGMVIPNSAINKEFTITTDSTVPVVVEIKNDTPDINKALDISEGTGNDFTVGDAIPFNIDFMVPSGIADKNNDNNYRYTEFNVIDTASENLALLDENIQLYAGDTLVDDVDYRIENSGNGFTLYFNSDPSVTTPNHLQLGAYAGQKLTLKFNMVLTEGAVPDETETNKPTLEYTNDGTEGSVTKPPVEVITYGHKFVKVDAVTGKEIAGAKFVVQKTVAGQIHYYTGKVGSAWSDDIKDAIVYQSNESGAVVVSGLEAGDYVLKETATSSDEYILPESGFEFNVVAGGFEGEDGITEVKNFEKGRLPITGGMGRSIFLLIGLATMLGVGIYYMKRRQQA